MECSLPLFSACPASVDYALFRNATLEWSSNASDFVTPFFSPVTQYEKSFTQASKSFCSTVGTKSPYLRMSSDWCSLGDVPEAGSVSAFLEAELFFPHTACRVDRVLAGACLALSVRSILFCGPISSFFCFDLLCYIELALEYFLFISETRIFFFPDSLISFLISNTTRWIFFSLLLPTFPNQGRPT